MTTLAYRRLLMGSAAAIFALIIFGGIAQITGSMMVCAAWPLCGGALGMGAAQLLAGVVVGGLVVSSGMVALQRRDADPWVRRPAILAPGLLLLQVILSALLLQLTGPALAWPVSLGLALLLLATLIIPAVAISVPAAETTARLGARAAAHARRYQRLTVVAALAVWVMTLTGIAVAETNLAALHAAHRGSVLVVALLLGWLFWDTWRTRRNDRALLLTAAAALVVLLTQALVGALNLLVALPPLVRSLHPALTTMLWSILVAFSILALRRPIPALDDRPARRTTLPAEAAVKQPSLIADYISLTKPKVISLLLVTTLAAMYITDQGAPALSLVFWTMLGGYLAAGGAGAINCAFDEDIDINMGRTSRRPVPSGRIPPRNAFWFGVALGVLAFVILAVFTTLLAAVLAMVGMVYYALFYTRWLKRSTWQNIVIGGGAGSLPPLVGWTAVTGSLTLPAVLLFVIIFYWTPPHFWALALVKQKDYARAGVPMLPVVAGEAETRWQILLYSLLMVALTLLLTPLQAMGWIYLALALLLGGIFLRYAWNVWRDGGQAHIWGLYKYSLLYLALLFAAMVVDRLVLT